MKKLAAINRLDPNNAENLDQFHASTTYDRIRAAQGARLSAALRSSTSPGSRAR